MRLIFIFLLIANFSFGQKGLIGVNVLSNENTPVFFSGTFYEDLGLFRPSFQLIANNNLFYVRYKNPIKIKQFDNIKLYVEPFYFNGRWENKKFTYSVPFGLSVHYINRFYHVFNMDIYRNGMAFEYNINYQF